MSTDTFFPTPAATDPIEGVSAPTRSLNLAAEPHSLLDDAPSAVDPDAVEQNAVVEAAPEGCGLSAACGVPDTSRAIDTGVPLQRGRSQLDVSASIDARLSHVLKAVADADFDSLDDAMMTYYGHSFENNESLRQGQRLNRIRRLPVLLSGLQLAAKGWSQLQRRSFQEQTIKSTEDILIAELELHLATRRRNHHNSTCSTEQRGKDFEQKARNESDIEAEVS